MSEVNPYIPTTCPSQRFCENHKYNTGPLFSAFYNENSSLHCGQQKIEYPKFEKSCGGSALPGNAYINVQPGEQLVACNGREYTDMYTNSNIASMRTGYIEPNNNKTPSLGVITAQRLGGRSTKEGFANRTFTGFTTDPLGVRGSPMTSSTAVTPFTDNVCGKRKPSESKKGVEKFCAACASPCGCAVLGVIVAILAIWLLVKFSDCWARDKTGRGVFTVGGMNSINFRKSGSNMNITGGGDVEESVDNDFAVI